jgi:hypothetical protein
MSRGLGSVAPGFRTPVVRADKEGDRELQTMTCASVPLQYSYCSRLCLTAILSLQYNYYYCNTV